MPAVRRPGGQRGRELASGMTRAPRFSGKVYVEADAASALARGQAKGWAYRYNLTAEGLQAEMGKPESERSEAGKDLHRHRQQYPRRGPGGHQVRRCDRGSCRLGEHLGVWQ